MLQRRFWGQGCEVMWFGAVWCNVKCVSFGATSCVGMCWWCFRGVFGGAVLMVFRAPVVWCFMTFIVLVLVFL